MVIRINRRLCVNCGSCVEECPTKALAMDSDEIAIVDPEKCDDCFRCLETCPSNSIRRSR